MTHRHFQDTFLDVLFPSLSLFILLFSIANYTVCDFESEQLCEWKRLSNKNAPWAMMEGQTSKHLDLPTRDHTTNSDKGES